MGDASRLFLRSLALHPACIFLRSNWLIEFQTLLGSSRPFTAPQTQLQDVLPDLKTIVKDNELQQREDNHRRAVEIRKHHLEE